MHDLYPSKEAFDGAIAFGATVSTGQNVDRLQRQWLRDFGRDPHGGLDAASVQTLRLAFARRHVLEHNGGVVDEAYTHETGQGAIGRRVRSNPAFVEEASVAAEALAERLEAAAL